MKLEGDISGKLKLNGKLSSLKHNGKLKVNFMKVRPTATKVRYFVKNQILDIEDSKLVLRNAELTDRYGNTAIVINIDGSRVKR